MLLLPLTVMLASHFHYLRRIGRELMYIRSVLCIKYTCCRTVRKESMKPDADGTNKDDVCKSYGSKYEGPIAGSTDISDVPKCKITTVLFLKFI